MGTWILPKTKSHTPVVSVHGNQNPLAVFWIQKVTPASQLAGSSILWQLRGVQFSCLNPTASPVALQMIIAINGSAGTVVGSSFSIFTNRKTNYGINFPVGSLLHGAAFSEDDDLDISWIATGGNLNNFESTIYFTPIQNGPPNRTWV